MASPSLQSSESNSARSSSMPRFLEKLYKEEAERQGDTGDNGDNAEEEAVTPSVSSSASSSGFSANLSGPGRTQSAPETSMSAATPFRQLGGPQYQQVPPSASSTASSEPPLDFYTDSLDGFSSSESVISASSASTSAISRSTSPSTRSAFPSSFYYSPSGSASSPSILSYHPSGPYNHLGPLTLPPPSLELPKTPSVSTPTAISASTKGKGKVCKSRSSSVASRSRPSSAAGTDSALGSPNFGDLTSSETQRAEDSPLDDDDSFDDSLLQPPNNFAMVCEDIYRSSFPSRKHYPFLQSLGLKTILTLVQDDYSPENAEFFASQGIKFLQIGIPGNKEPFVTIPDEKIRNALSVVLDKRNHPMLIHCNKGKHRTGCLVGCLRKMQSWSSAAIFEEYRKFSFPKSRAMDHLFIDLFQPDWESIDAENLPTWCQREDKQPPPTCTETQVAAKVETTTQSISAVPEGEVKEVQTRTETDVVVEEKSPATEER